MGTAGVGTAERMDDWPGPGAAFNTRYEEGNMRNLVETWVRYMRRPNGDGA
jgi:hypothetical protein